MEELELLEKEAEMEFPDSDNENLDDNEDIDDGYEDSDNDNDNDDNEIADDEDLEDVGNEDVEEGATSKEDGFSPKIYSSIAKVLKEEGAFYNISDDEVDSLNNIDDFVEFIRKKHDEDLDEDYKTIKKFVNNDVPVSEYSKLLKIKETLDSYDEDFLRNDDDPSSAEIRKSIIIEDCIARGYSKEKALKIYDRSFKNGDEIDDALEALDNLKEAYNNRITLFKQQAEQYIADEQNKRKEILENKRKKINEDPTLFGGYNLSKKQREAIWDVISKPVAKTKKGQTLNALQKWMNDDIDSFEAAAGLMYVLTNGGKDFSKILKDSAKKEISKARRDLENALRSSSYDDGGKLRMVNGPRGNNDKESKYSDYKILL